MLLKHLMSVGKKFSLLSSGKVISKIMNQPDYSACINILNNLQSNSQYIKAVSNSTSPTHGADTLTQVRKYLTRTGLTLEQLDKLPVIHVTGTKGKGTTCAFTESILRHHGYTTGFYSSPHLLEVRERIRINGKPIGKDEFASHFWRIYTQLDQQKNDDGDMPLYFRFLTIMAFTIFLEKNVDVAIIEVGIGGEYDCTNILRKVPIVGITSLGIDHTSLLGNTIESIAWHKGGIMKEGCKAFTVPQTETALKVLQERSTEKKCHLQVVDTLHLPIFNNNNKSYPSDILSLNASLAVSLSEAWISQNNNSHKVLSKEIVQRALSTCVWLGRFQVKHSNGITYYLDGAHTRESIEVCSKWFNDMAVNSKHKRALMFNITGDRNAESLLKPLKQCKFDIVLFVTNIARSDSEKSDTAYFRSTETFIKKCEQHKELWIKLEQTDGQKAEIIEVFPTVLDAITFLKTRPKCELLVTGSLHLIGSVLSILEPHLNSNV